LILFAVWLILKLINRRWWVRLSSDTPELMAVLKAMEWRKIADVKSQSEASSLEFHPNDTTVGVEERLMTPLEPMRTYSRVSDSAPQIPWRLPG